MSSENRRFCQLYEMKNSIIQFNQYYIERFRKAPINLFPLFTVNVYACAHSHKSHRTLHYRNGLSFRTRSMTAIVVVLNYNEFKFLYPTLDSPLSMCISGVFFVSQIIGCAQCPSFSNVFNLLARCPSRIFIRKFCPHISFIHLC